MEFTGLEALIAIGVALGTAVAVYLVSVFGIKEKSFEEAIAEQKKRSDDLLGNHKPHKKKIPKDKNPNKKLKKREKLQSELSDELEHEVEERKRTIEIIEEPEILDEQEDEAHETEKGKVATRRPSIPTTRRDSIIKPILLNKDETPVVTSNPPTEQLNNFEQIHPKDDCELKHQETSTPPSPHPKSGSNTPVDEVTDSPATKRSRKKHLTKDEDLTSVRIEQLIERLPLTSSEIQNLIDSLLNKQHAGDNDWVKNTKSSSNNSVGDLKRQLDVKDKMLEDEKSSVRALQDKLKDLRNEFTAEKTKFANVRRTLEEQAQSKHLEMSNLQLRLRQVGEISMNEKQELQKQLGRMQVKFKDVQDEYEAIKSDYRNYRDAEQTIRSKADTLERESGALKTQCGHLENQLKNAFASNQEMSNQIRTLHENLRASEERKKEAEFSYNAEYRKLQDRETVLLNELANLKSNFTVLESENAKLREHVNGLECNVKGLEEVNGKYEETRKSEVTLKNIVNELKSTVSQLNEHAVEKEARIAELESELNGLRAQVRDLEKCNVGAAGKEHENLALQSEVNELKQQVETLHRDVAAGKSKNDELRVKNQKLVESLNVTEQSLQSRIEGSEKQLNAEETRKREALNIVAKILEQTPQLDNDNWVVSALNSINDYVVELKQRPVEIPQVNESFEDKTKELEEKVTHYQSMLKETEGLLSSLQASINLEESKWVSQTAEKDKEIERLRAEVAEHTNKPVASDNTPEIEELKRTNASLEESLSTQSSRVKELTAELASATERVKSLESGVNGKMNGEEERIINDKHSGETPKSTPNAQEKTPAPETQTPTQPQVTPQQDVTSSPPVSKEKKKKKKAKH